jgi:hypothetical protein
MSVQPLSATARGGPRVDDRLAAVRARRFVGRSSEIDSFAAALDSVEPPFIVMHVHGPGGIGKTTLLQQFARLTRRAGRAALRLDLRDTEPSVEVFRVMLGRAIGVESGAEQDLIARWPHDGVLIIDTYDPDSPVDRWLREIFLPRLPANLIVVTAGRKAPGVVWSSDIEWASLARVVALRNLEPEESRQYLALRGVPASRQEEILACTYGHPLALSLAADSVTRQMPGENDGRAFDLRQDADLVRTLLQKLIDEPPSPRHLLALHACASVCVLTEPLLAAALDERAAHEIFEWLANQSFIESSSLGLFPHDLAREVLYADSRLRSLDARRQLNGRLLGHLYERFLRTQGIDQLRTWFDVMYLQRSNSGMRPYFVWNAIATNYFEAMRPADAAPIIEMTRRHEGDESAAIAAYWLRRQPEAFLALRDSAGQLVGFVTLLRLAEFTAEDRRADPAAEKVHAYIQQQGAAREGEEIDFTRFFMSRDDHQSNPATMNAVAARTSVTWTTQPRLAWSFCAVADAPHFEPLLSGLHFWRAPEADFEVGGHRYGVFGHDWRVESVAQWMMIKIERASQDDGALIAQAPVRPLRVLSKTDFSKAVHEALRAYSRAEELSKNPLLRTRLLLTCADADALKTMLLEAVKALGSNPKDRKAHQSMWHTFIEPAATQEQSAERVGLPFNTYRYQLGRGIEAVIQQLWTREIGV